MDKTPLLTTQELADRWAISAQTLLVYRKKQKGPPYIRIGQKYRYNLHDIRKYEAKHTELIPLNTASRHISDNIELISDDDLKARWFLSDEVFDRWGRRNTEILYTSKRNMYSGELETGYSLPEILSLECRCYIACQSGPVEFTRDTVYLPVQELNQRWRLGEYTLRKWAYTRQGAGYVKPLPGVYLYPLEAIYMYERNSTAASSA